MLLGRADPKLLHTCTLERYAKARELIDFNRDMAKRFRNEDSIHRQRHALAIPGNTDGIFRGLYGWEVIVVSRSAANKFCRAN
ncbi:MAG: hypothetical protein KDE56_04660 [Anaerolineales bacterium]|nr:hypothetical protein [Anaerolineales bacterium]